jgi:hypothetical protein
MDIQDSKIIMLIQSLKSHSNLRENISDEDLINLIRKELTGMVAVVESETAFAILENKWPLVWIWAVHSDNPEHSKKLNELMDEQAKVWKCTALMGETVYPRFFKKYGYKTKSFIVEKKVICE